MRTLMRSFDSALRAEPVLSEVEGLGMTLGGGALPALGVTKGDSRVCNCCCELVTLRFALRMIDEMTAMTMKIAQTKPPRLCRSMRYVGIGGGCGSSLGGGVSDAPIELRISVSD